MPCGVYPRKPIGRRPRPIVDNGDGTCTVVLTQGQRATIDTADRSLVEGYSWCAEWSRLTKSFYAVTTVYDGGPKTKLAMHRVIMGVTDPMVLVDHRDHATTDNRRDNLRACSKAENCRNRRQQGGSSSHKGVSWHKRVGQWYARIAYDGKTSRLGYFDSEEEAALELHGEFAVLNFPEDRAA